MDHGSVSCTGKGPCYGNSKPQAGWSVIIKVLCKNKIKSNVCFGIMGPADWPMRIQA